MRLVVARFGLIDREVSDRGAQTPARQSADRVGRRYNRGDDSALRLTLRLSRLA